MTDSFEDMANAYEQEVYSYAKANPGVHKGQVVKVWNHDNSMNPIYCGLGLIKSLEWSDDFMQYMVVIDFTFNNKVKEYTVFASECEPVRGNVKLEAVR